jgi:hypothetical protein
MRTNGTSTHSPAASFRSVACTSDRDFVVDSSRTARSRRLG